MTLAGPTGSTPWNVTISYGDGSAPVVEQVAAGSSIGLDHLYTTAGNRTVTDEIHTCVGAFETLIPASIVLAQVPAEAITSPAAGAPRPLTNQPTSFAGSLQNPYVGVSYQATWTFTDLADLSLVLDRQPDDFDLDGDGCGSPSRPPRPSPRRDLLGRAVHPGPRQRRPLTSVQTVGGAAARINVIQFIATSTTVAAANTTYDGTAYHPATGGVVGTDQSIVTSPAVTYVYYNSTDTGLTTSLASAPADAGSYLVVASFAGNSTYTASQSQAVAFTIGQAPLTVTIADASKVYGVDDSASLTGTVAGLQNNDPIAVHYSSLGSAATAGVGTYAITASLSGNPVTLADYAVTFTNAARTQAVGTLSVTADHTRTTVSAGSGTSNWGAPVTFSATVANSDSGIAAVGTVDFTDTTTGTDLGHATPNGSGVATLTPSVPLPAGTQTIAVTYGGGGGFSASSASLSVVILPSIYVLNATAAGALNVSGSSTISVPGTVQVDSSSSTAIVLSGSTRVTASTIGAVGGSSVTGSSRFGVTSTRVAAFADPLANLPVPSPAGMRTYLAVNIGGVTSATIAPGIYPSISISGSARLTMQPGIYVITGGGFSLSGAGSVTGSGVFIYNAGSNYNGGSGSTFGSFNLSSGTISLSPQTTGPYAGILLFQSRDNTRALSISGAVAAGLGAGVVYAPSALLQLSGSAQIGTSGQSVSPLVVNELALTGNTGAYQLDSGSDLGGSDSSFNWITDPVLTVAAEDDDGQGLDPNELSDVGGAMTYLNQALATFGVNLSWAPADTNADVTVHFASTTPGGGVGDGVLGYTTVQNDVYFVTGWNYFTASDPSQIGAGQYDFTTLAIHELAHTLGLGESQDVNSVMYEYLTTGTVRRTLTDSNLSLIDTDADRFMKAARPATPTLSAGPIGLTSPARSGAAIAPTDPRTRPPRQFDSAPRLPRPRPPPSSPAGRTRSSARSAWPAIASVAQGSDLVSPPIAQDFLRRSRLRGRLPSAAPQAARPKATLIDTTARRTAKCSATARPKGDERRRIEMAGDPLPMDEERQRRLKEVRDEVERELAGGAPSPRPIGSVALSRAGTRASGRCSSG